MKRRPVVLILIAAILVATGPVIAQQPSRIPVVGVLITHVPLTDPFTEIVRSSFRAIGYEDGRNIQLEFVTALGQFDRLPALAKQLVDARVDAIIAPNEMSARVAQKATTVIPIVMFVWGRDPVELGLITSYNRPGGNITGVYSMAAELDAKRLELIKETFPSISRVAVFWDPSFGGQPTDVQRAGKTLGLAVQLIEVRGPEDLVPAFKMARQKGAGAVLLAQSPVFYGNRDRVAAAALEARMPTMVAYGEQVRAGLLMSYGNDIDSIYQRAAYYVDRLLKSSKASDLPVEQVATFKFVVNQRTAKALGITIPKSIMLRANEVIR